MSLNSKIAAPSTAGIPKIKLKSNAAVFESPKRSATEIVEPEREIPGRVATACAQPIISAIGSVISTRVDSFFATLDET